MSTLRSAPISSWSASLNKFSGWYSWFRARESRPDQKNVIIGRFRGESETVFVEPALMKVHSSLYPTRSRYLPYKLNAFHRSSIKPCGSRKKWPRSRLEEPAGMRSTLSFPAIILKTTATSMPGEGVSKQICSEKRDILQDGTFSGRFTLFDIRSFFWIFAHFFAAILLVSSMFEFLTLRSMEMFLQCSLSFLIFARNRDICSRVVTSRIKEIK